MHKCTIMNNDPLTSFRLFDVAELIDDTTCYSSNNDVTGSGYWAPSVCFGIDVGDVKHPKA